MKPLLLLILASLLGRPLQAAPYTSDPLDLELISEVSQITPGKPFFLALKFDLKDHWHIYWKNPGDSGFPPQVEWELPEGFSAGELEFPYPLDIPTPPLATFGYEGQVLLLAKITPPASLSLGATVSLKAEVSWLVCKEVCQPGSASLAIRLPVSEQSPRGPQAALFDHARKQQPDPAPLTGWSAAKDGRLQIPTTALKDVAAPLHFFPYGEMEFVHTAAQTLTVTDDSLQLQLTPNANPDEPLTGIRGVIVSAGGWNGSDHLALEVDLPFGAASSPTTSGVPGAGLSFGILLAAFIGGLILNLMPCVFPVLGLKIMSFVQQAGEERSKVAAHGLWFTAGVLVSFWVLAGVLIAIRAGGQELGWGFQLQSPMFVYGLAILLFAFALNLSGVFEVGTSLTAVGGKFSEGHGYSGTFFSGVLATLVATPCAAPFLAPALGAALALPAASSMLVFTLVALGLSTPYLLLSLYPALIEKLPRPGAWMETFKQAMAFLLYGTVAYLVWVLLGQVSESGALLVLFGLVLVALAVWALGRFAPFGTPPRKMWITRFISLILLAAALHLGHKASEPSEITWEKWSPERVQALQAEGRTVYVDFTARWCATCQVNKKVVFGSDAVIARFKEKKVAALKADWTNHDALITRTLEAFGRSAVPFNLVYTPGQDEPIQLPELLTPGAVLDALP